jgi:hypothetical protein
MNFSPTHLQTREIRSLLFVPPWCTLLVERPCLHCHSSKENDAIKVKLRSCDHISTNSKHACAEGSVTNLKRCYGESADNFWLTYVHTTKAVLQQETAARTGKGICRPQVQLPPTILHPHFPSFPLLSELTLDQWSSFYHVPCCLTHSFHLTLCLLGTWLGDHLVADDFCALHGTKRGVSFSHFLHTTPTGEDKTPSPHSWVCWTETYIIHMNTHVTSSFHP